MGLFHAAVDTHYQEAMPFLSDQENDLVFNHVLFP